MSQRTKIITVTLSDDEFDLFQGALTVQDTNAATQLRALLLAWAHQILLTPGKTSGGQCAKCHSPGAFWWHTVDQHFLCADCKHGPSFIDRAPRGVALEDVQAMEHLLFGVERAKRLVGSLKKILHDYSEEITMSETILRPRR